MKYFVAIFSFALMWAGWYRGMIEAGAAEYLMAVWFWSLFAGYTTWHVGFFGLKKINS